MEGAEEGGDPPSQLGSASLLYPENGTKEPRSSERSSIWLWMLPCVSSPGLAPAKRSQLLALEFPAANKGLLVFSDGLWIWLGSALVSDSKRQLSLLEERIN